MEETSRVKRQIVLIDDEKCTGCGACLPSCAEGALELKNGKARLIKELFCDGLGACLGTCPEGAITIEAREADPFDEEAVKEHLRAAEPAAGCPGSESRGWSGDAGSAVAAHPQGGPSELRQWPVQIRLVSPAAPFLRNADLLVCADCVPFAYAGLHGDLLSGRRVLVGCPKLDDIDAHTEKLRTIFASSRPRSVTVAVMEVPCCQGLVQAVREALKQANAGIEARVVVLSVEGKILD